MNCSTGLWKFQLLSKLQLTSFHLCLQKYNKNVNCCYLEGSNSEVRRLYIWKKKSHIWQKDISMLLFEGIRVIYSYFLHFIQVKITSVLKKMRKFWLFCMIHVWTVTLTQILGNTTNWHGQNIWGYYFVFTVSSNFLQNLTEPYNLLYNLKT